MSLESEVMQQMKVALKEKDQAKLRTLRAIKNSILLAQTEKGGSDELTEEQEVKILQKMAKQRRDSIAIFEDQKREDLAEIEREELEIIESFLPKMMTEDEIEAELRTIISQTGATSVQDMGKVMGIANKQMAGKADMSLVSKKVRELLS